MVMGLGLGVVTPDGAEIPIISPSGSLLPLGAIGSTYFVDADNGSNSSDGMSWDTAFATMAAAFAVVKSGGVIYLRGRLAEQATTPTGKTDVTIIGAGTTPRAGNTLDGGPKRGGANWRPIGTPTAPLLTVTQQGWRVVNIYFTGATGYESISLVRDAGTGVAEKNAGHFSAIGCDFTGGLGGVWDTGGANNVKLIGCEFRNMTGATDFAVKTVTTAIAVPLWWTIQECNFRNNKNHVSFDSQEGLVKDCVFEAKGHGITTVIKLNTLGPLGQGANNIVTGCVFGGDFRDNNNEYQHGADDMWYGNHAGLIDGIPQTSGTHNALPTT